MKTWFVRTFKKSSIEVLNERSVDALTAEKAAEQVEDGPVRF